MTQSAIVEVPEVFPFLKATAGNKLHGKLCTQVRPWYLRLAERDLPIIGRFLSTSELRKHYVRPLLTDTLGTVAEIFAVARGIRCATALTPHAPGPGGANFDALLGFGPDLVGFEIKHRRDNSPFDGRKIEVEGGLELYESERPGADPKISGAPISERFTRKVPPASIWRDVMEDAASQLRRDLPNVIAVSVDNFGEIEGDLVAALLGDPYFIATPGETGSSIRTARYDNGVFLHDSFSHIAGVWFFKLHPESLAESATDYESVCNWARFARNPKCSIAIPESLLTSMFWVYDRPPDQLPSADA
jgi:hypothetical protein